MTRALGPVALALACAGSLLRAPAAHADLPVFDPAAIYAVPLGDAPRRGPADAPVTVVVWSDFACRYCAALEGTLEQVERLYPGKLRWVYRHFPLDPRDTTAAEAAIAAGNQGAFWPMRDRLMAIRGKVDRAAVESIAAELGLELGRFRGDLDAGAGRPIIAADVDAALALGITGTPTAFVNGRALRGSQPVAAYVRVIDEELRRAGGAAGGAVADYATLTADGMPRAASDPDLIIDPVDDLDLARPVAVGLGLPGHVDGPADALVTVVMFTDLECGYCRASTAAVSRLRAEYPDDVRVAYRHLPLARHRAAGPAAEAVAYAATVGKFAPMYARLMAGTRLTRADLEVAGAEVGLDRAGLADALDQHRFREAVMADAAIAGALGVGGTPTFFVNGTPLPGQATWERLQPVVEAALVGARALEAAGVARGDVYAVLAGMADRKEPGPLPTPASVALEPGAAAREVAAIAACRMRDAAGARGQASRLVGAAALRTRVLCAGLGIDL
jgi:protein-disulfide isomerase